MAGLFFRLIKTLFLLAVLVFIAGAVAVFYFGYRLGDSSGEGGVPAEEVLGGRAPAAELSKRISSPGVRAKAVLLELHTKKKTAERHLKAAREELIRCEKNNTDAGKIDDVRERIVSLSREIKNCDFAIKTASDGLKGSKAEVEREREDVGTILEKLD